MSAAIAPGFFYTTIFIKGSTYTNNQIAILKLTYNEGKLVWAKKMLPRNIVDQYDLVISGFFDLMSNPKDPRYLLTSIAYWWNAGTGMVLGNAMLYDNGTDISSIFDYQYAPVASRASQGNIGQVYFDEETDHVYLTSLLYLSSSTYRDMMLMKVQASTGILEWSLMFPTTAYNLVGILNPAVTINTFTQKIYCAAQSTSYSIHIAAVSKSGNIYIRQLLKLA